MYMNYLPRMHPQSTGPSISQQSLKIYTQQPARLMRPYSACQISRPISHRPISTHPRYINQRDDVPYRVEIYRMQSYNIYPGYGQNSEQLPYRHPLYSNLNRQYTPSKQTIVFDCKSIRHRYESLDNFRRPLTAIQNDLSNRQVIRFPITRGIPRFNPDYFGQNYSIPMTIRQSPLQSNKMLRSLPVNNARIKDKGEKSSVYKQSSSDTTIISVLDQRLDESRQYNNKFKMNLDAIMTESIVESPFYFRR